MAAVRPPFDMASIAAELSTLSQVVDPELADMCASATLMQLLDPSFMVLSDIELQEHIKQSLTTLSTAVRALEMVTPICTKSMTTFVQHMRVCSIYVLHRRAYCFK
jgi:hypothetical protein